MNDLKIMNKERTSFVNWKMKDKLLTKYHSQSHHLPKCRPETADQVFSIIYCCHISSQRPSVMSASYHHAMLLSLCIVAICV